MEAVLENTVLDSVKHSRLLSDMTGVCTLANIPPSYVKSSMKGVCSPKEVDWVRRFNALREAGLGGIVLSGVSNSQARCLAIGGALIRNFIDARVLSLAAMIESKSDVPNPTVLVMPNFYLKSVTKSNTAWKGQVMYDTLMSRMVASRPTVLVIEDFESMTQEYGMMVRELLTSNFWIVQE